MVEQKSDERCIIVKQNENKKPYISMKCRVMKQIEICLVTSEGFKPSTATAVMWYSIQLNYEANLEPQI